MRCAIYPLSDLPRSLNRLVYGLRHELLFFFVGCGVVVWVVQDSHQHRQLTPLRGTSCLLNMVGLEEKQVRRATAALLKYVKSSADVGKASLMDDEGEVILAQLSLHKIPGNVTTKPIQIAIPHPMRNRDDCDMCLFVKDNAKGWIKEMMDKEPVEGLTKVRNCTATSNLILHVPCLLILLVVP